MIRALLWLLVIILFIAGLVGAFTYLVALAIASDRGEFTSAYGSLFAFSMVGALAGLLAIATLTRRLPYRTRLPNEWLSFVAFGVAVGTGGVLAVTESIELASPFLALAAAAALFGFLGRLVTRWSPAREVGSRGFLLPALWGAIGAPLVAGLVQIGTVVMLIAGGAAGIYLADESLTDNVEPWLTEVTESADLSVIETATVSFAAVGVLGVTAPLTEELAKFLGVYLLFRNRVATKYGLFVAGAASGLGFAIVESLGYALMAAETWPQIMLIRAPVAFIHIAATSIVALGWYQHRRHGGYALIGFFALSVLLHAAWNTLFVSMMITAGGIDDPDTVDAAAAGLVLLLVGAMGVVMLASVMWIIGNARRLGRESHLIDESPTTISPASGLDTAAPYAFRT